MDNFNATGGMTLTINIQEAFKTNSAITGWVLSGYALTLGSFIMITGKLADIFGPHNVYLCGLFVMWVCALICACLPHTSIIPLIVFRALQGIGASALIPSTISLTANYFSGSYSKYLNRCIVIMIVVLTSSMGFGLILGGAFSETSIGYRAFFYFNFAYTFIVDVILLFLIIPINKTEDHKRLHIRQLDFVAAFLVVVGILLMILGLIEGGEKWKSAKAIAPLIVGFFTFISAFLYETYYLRRYQLRHQDKDKSFNWKLQVQLLFPPELLKIPNFFPFLVVCGLYFGGYTMILVTGIQYYSFIEHNSPIICALKVFPATFGLIFGASVYRYSYYSKIGLRKMLILSSVLSLGGAIWFSRINYNIKSSYWKYNFIALFLYGYGLNMFFNIYLVIVVEHTPLHLQGVVSGVYQTCSQVLLSIGNALVPSVIGTVDFATTLDEKQGLHEKFRTVLYIAIAFQAVPVLIFLFCLQNPQRKGEQSEVEVVEIPEKNESLNDLCNQSVESDVATV
ncbi:hypothetical protein CANINC_004696 [Pichia inconspicua]|uniref:Major facilitator superfamily (MFS) profile domain-containing protein n=1 Tax=Pichia inconspicua TaxID=52247 RepID=A0A4T0WW44_9ASCO|nr:hypothetical protein CANINC_004696 [[Candida] inconspicua]